MNTKSVVLLFGVLVVVIFGIVVVAAVVTSSFTNTVIVASPGTAVYSDAGLQTPLSSITWGTAYKTIPLTRTIYVKNTGNVPITLAFAVIDIAPTEFQAGYLSNNYAGQTLAVAGSLPIVLTLTIPSNSNATTASFTVTVSS